MKEGWQTALSLERRVFREREQVSAAIVSRDQGRRGKEECQRNYGDDTMASILTPSRKQNDLFANEAAAWRAAYGAIVSAIYRGLRVALGETQERENEREREKGSRLYKNHRAESSRRFVSSSRLHSPSCSFHFFISLETEAYTKWMYWALFMKGITIFFLNVAYVTPFDKSDNLAFSKEIEILDSLSCCFDDCLDEY